MKSLYVVDRNSTMDPNGTYCRTVLVLVVLEQHDEMLLAGLFIQDLYLVSHQLLLSSERETSHMTHDCSTFSLLMLGQCFSAFKVLIYNI